MKKLVLIIVLVYLAQSIAAMDVTSYSSLNHLWYESGSQRLEAEETAVIALFAHVHPLLRVRITTGEDETRSLLQAGFVWIAAGGLYGEAAWGASVNGTGTIVQDGVTSITHEGPNSLAAARLVLRFNHASETLSLAPDLSLRYQFFGNWATKGQYFFGWDSRGTETHSLALEQDFGLGTRVHLMLLSSGTMDRSNYNPEREPRYGWALGIRVQTLLGDVTGKPLSVAYLVQVHQFPSGIFALENGLSLKLPF